jgi:hypothetical protein
VKQVKMKNKFFSIAAILFIVAISVYACQNKKATKAMSEENLIKQPVDSGSLFSVANLEQSDSGRRAVAWFFETPRIFEFSLATDQSRHFYNMLKEAKEKQLPVNVQTRVEEDKNMIVLVTPATEDQIIRYMKEKGQHQQPVKVTPPPNQ